MANNLVVQLLLKTGTFSTDLKKAGGQVQQFKKGCDTAGKSVSAFGSALGIDVGMLTKFGGAVGAAVVAGKTFKAMIDSNQESADTFKEVIYAAKTVVGELAYSFATFDFSNFNNGLDDLIGRAREAAAAIDQLGNTLMSYSVLEAEANAAVANARKVSNDKNATPEQKEAANQAAREALKRLSEGAELAQQDYFNAAMDLINSKGGKLSAENGIDVMGRFFKLNATKGREEAKAFWDGQWEAYVDASQKAAQKYGGEITAVGSGNYGYTSLSNNMYKNNPEYQAAQDALDEQYADAITYHVMLGKLTDEELDKTGKMYSSAVNLNTSLAQLTNRMEMVENKTGKAAGSAGDMNKAVKGSMEYCTKMARELTTTRDKQVLGSAEWVFWDTQLKLILADLEKINAEMDKMRRKESEEKYKDYREPILKNGKQIQLGKAIDTTNGGGLAEDIKKRRKTLNQWIHERDLLLKNRGDLTEEDIAPVNKRLAEVGQNITKLENLGVPDLSANKKAADSWDYINEALENTSNIMTNLMDTFKEGTEVTASSILRMVSTSLPALYSLITAVMALAGVEATEKAVETSKHWVEAIAAVAALGSVVAAALSSAKSQKFANGGIVGGTSFTGDRVTAQVNSGEMVLTKAQQANLFRMANSGVGGGGKVEFHISGTELVGVLNNANRKNNLIR